MLFGNLSNYHIRYLAYSPVFRSARLASEQVPFKLTYRRLEMICLQLTTPFAGNKVQKPFLGTFSYRDCCVSVKMRPTGYFISPHSALGAV